MKRLFSNISRQKAFRIGFLMALDALLINATSILAILLQENLSWTKMMWQPYMHVIVPYSVISTIVIIGIFIPFKLYNSLWEFAGVDELFHIVVAGAIVSILKFIVNSIPGIPHFQVSYPLISGILLVGAVGLSRMAYRVARTVFRPSSQPGKVRTLLVGAGKAGAMALRELQTSERSLNDVVCIVDDDFSKRGSFLRNIKICGACSDIPAIVKQYKIEISV